MDYLYQRVSYLKGMAQGLDIDQESKEGKLLLNIVDALEDFADAIVELAEDYGDLEEYVSYIDEDLTDVEDELYDFEDDEDYYSCEDFDDEDFECIEIDCNCPTEEIIEEEIKE
ncbi:MAG: hypothetical protein GX320_09525 [Tissierellia bacterium]|nr:hypothetical protein [Tissierellia bacterium]